jgi:hypothetical protein
VKILFDVDTEIESAAPAAPLVDGDHIVVAGGDAALLALVRRDTGVVERALFNNEPNVDVFAPVRLLARDVGSADDSEARYAFASIDRQRLQLNVTVVDRHLRVLRTRDISSDDEETPELLEGTLAHLSAHGAPDEMLLVVGVRDHAPHSERKQLVRCVWAADLAPRWSSMGDDALGADGAFVVTRRRDEYRALFAADGNERWRSRLNGAALVRVGDGRLVLAHRDEPVDESYALPATIELAQVENYASLHTVGLEYGTRPEDAHPSGTLFTLARRNQQRVLFHANAKGGELVLDHDARIVSENVALVGPDVVYWPNPAVVPDAVPFDLTARARATVDGDTLFVRDGRRLLALALE